MINGRIVYVPNVECGMKFKWVWIEGEEQNAKAD